MEKRLILAIGLSILVLVAWGKMFPPPERPAAPTPVDTATTLDEPTPTENPEAPAGDTETEPEPSVAVETIGSAAEEQVHVSGDFFEVVLTNRGGRVLSWALKEYTTPQGDPLELFPHFVSDKDLPLQLELDDPRMTAVINDGLYQVSRTDVPAEGAQSAGERVTFTWADGTGLSVTKSLTFRRREYLVDVAVEVVDRGRRLTPRLAIGPGFSAQETRAGRSNYYYDSQAVWDVGGVVSRTKKGKLKDDGSFRGKVFWAGLEDQFFTALVVPRTDRTEVSWHSVERMAILPGEDAQSPQDPASIPIVGVAVPDSGARLYVGPKKYTELVHLGDQLEEVVWFSRYGWLAWIVRHIYLGLLWLYANVAGNYGVAIIMATVVLRLVLFPINQYAMVSMKKSQLQMQRLQPKIKHIKNKYRKQKDAQSRAKMNQEMMDLYKREGINPMGGVTGCLPLFAQFPILIGFYNMLTVAVELRGAPFFGWIQDLSVKDPYWITPLLMGVTMFWQQRMAMSKITDPQQLQQQRFMMFMPFFFTFICLQMPAGLVLYWFVNNLLGMGQQWLVNRHTTRLEAASDLKSKRA